PWRSCSFSLPLPFHQSPARCDSIKHFLKRNIGAHVGRKSLAGACLIARQHDPLKTRKACHHRIEINTEIDQTCDFVNACIAETLNHLQTTRWCSKESAGLVETVTCVRDERVQVLFREVSRIHIVTRSLHQAQHLIQRTFQVIAQRATNLFTDGFLIFPNESMDHQGHVAHVRAVAVFAPCTTVKSDLFRQELNALAQQVSQHVSAHLTGKTKRLGWASRRQPNRQLTLNRPRQRFDSKLLTVNTGKSHCFPAPETTHRFNLAHRHLFATRIVLRRKQKIVSIPARSKRNSDSTVREIV